MKLIYMGTPDFAVPALQALYDAGHEIKYVVTQPDTVRDRGKKVKFPPVKERAVELGIPVLQPEKLKYNEEFLETIRAAEVDAIIVAAYGKIITRRILDTPKYGCLNIHGSLLPRFRGAAPIQAAIAAGDEETGITIMQMAKGLDTGDMLAKAATPIEDKTGEQLHDELAEMGAKLICETLTKLEAGEITPEKQDDSLSTYAPMISKEDGHVDFTLNAKEIERKIRAFNPWPGSFASLGDKTYKFWKAEVLATDEAAGESSGEKPVPGTVLAAGNQGLEIATGLGILRVTELQAPGRKRVSAADYFRGNSIEIGSVLR
ncbi:MAG: methionyl-tRNA formyltransferase [Clostridia bacterium]|nr:methionyl-tRNA formyltransferase [Clostridia bacterium]